ncbi:predicted protein [Chaetoceros tenuissimus]|uniref:Uncharacterized protein n=1 Tax=Chaetoceros tenuissimus TaxID=426638 RepID=A0AAD3H4R2_9STRA|nr:predicted protein [Chaetoceros tenuissimus]
MDNKSTPYAYSISKIGSTYKPTMKPGDIIEYRDYLFQTPCFALVTDVHPNREHPIFCDEIAHFSLHGSYHTYTSFSDFKRVAELKPDGHHVPITHPGELLWKDKDGFNYLKGSLKKDYVIPDMFNSFVNDVAEAWSDTKKRASSYSTSQHYSSTVKVQNSLGHIYDASQLKQASESPDNFNSFANDVGTVWSDIPEKRASSYSATGDDSKIDVQNSLGHIYNTAPLKPAPKPPIFLLSDSEDSSQEGDFVSFHTKRTKNSGPYSSKPSGSGSASKPSASKSHLVKLALQRNICWL